MFSVTVIEMDISNPSSDPICVTLCCNVHEKGMNLSLSLSYEQIVGKTGLFSHSIGTTLEVPWLRL